MLVCSSGSGSLNPIYLHDRIKRLTDQTSLEKDASRRATPWRMLDHPWMIEMSNKRVNMEHFLKTVWDWE